MDAGPVAMVRLVAHASSTVGVIDGWGAARTWNECPAGLFPALRMVMATSGAQLCAHAYRRTKAFPSTVRVCSAAAEIGRFTHQLRKPGFAPRFSFGPSGSVLPDVAVGIEIAVRVVSGVVQVPHVLVVITEVIAGRGALGERSGGAIVVVVHGVVVVMVD